MSRCEAKEVSIDQEQLAEPSQGKIIHLATSSSDDKKSEYELVDKSEIVVKKTAQCARFAPLSDDKRPEGGAASESLSYDELKTVNTSYQLINMVQVSLGRLS